MFRKVRPPKDENSQESLIKFLLVGGSGFFLFPVFASITSPLFGRWMIPGLVVYIIIWALVVRGVMNGKIKPPAFTWEEEQRRKTPGTGKQASSFGKRPKTKAE